MATSYLILKNGPTKLDMSMVLLKTTKHGTTLKLKHRPFFRYVNHIICILIYINENLKKWGKIVKNTP